MDLSFCESYVIMGGGWGLFGSPHLNLSFHPQEWASCLFFKEKLGESPSSSEFLIGFPAFVVCKVWKKTQNKQLNIQLIF